MRHKTKRQVLSTLSNWTLCIVCLGSILEALPLKPTRAPKQLSRDCTTLIVTNDRRLSPLRNSPGQGGTPSTGCQGGRQARKLPAAVSSLFREDVDNYPEDEIREVLKKTAHDIKDLYNVYNTRLDPNTNLTERVAFYPAGDEDGYVEREENVCRTVTRNIYPREAKLHNSLVYIPNHQEFMQVIQAEICQHPDEECSYLRDNLPYGLVSACVQKYSYKKLLYMDPLDKRMASDLFRYPSCCVCNVRTLPLDLRSTPGNHSQASHRSVSSSSTPNVLVATTPTSDTDNSATNAPYYASANNGLGPSQQPTERSQESERLTPVSSATRRASKQLRQPTNQTLVLSDDKVYAPVR